MAELDKPRAPHDSPAMRILALLLALSLPGAATAQDYLAEFDRLLTLAPGVSESREDFTARLAETYPDLTVEPPAEHVEGLLLPDDYWTRAQSGDAADGIDVTCTRSGSEALAAFRSDATDALPTLSEMALTGMDMLLSAPLQPKLQGVPDDAARAILCTVAFGGYGLTVPDHDAMLAHVERTFADLVRDFETPASYKIVAAGGPIRNQVVIQHAEVWVDFPYGTSDPMSRVNIRFVFVAFELAGTG